MHTVRYCSRSIRRNPLIERASPGYQRVNTWWDLRRCYDRDNKTNTGLRGTDSTLTGTLVTGWRHSTYQLYIHQMCQRVGDAEHVFQGISGWNLQHWTVYVTVCDEPILQHEIKPKPCRRKEGNGLFNDALKFYLRLYGVRHMIKDHSDSKRGNPLPPLHGLLFLIKSNGYFICTIPQTG